VTDRDGARLWPPLAALGVAVALAVLLASVARAVNRPPVILGWEARPAHVARTEAAELRVSASDPDGDALRFEYRAERGRIAVDPAHADRARYTPPRDGAVADRVTVVCVDTRGQRATATTAITTDPIAAAAAPSAVLTEAPPAPTLVAAATARPSPSPPPPPNAAPTAPPTAAPTPAPSRAPAAPAVAVGPNHAPVLDKGTTITGIGTRSVLLVANGYDPDGDPIEYEWDTKGCFDVISQSQTTAEVKLGYCGDSAIRLTWKDPKGLTAFAEWTISK
jgi:hypothetical protein